MNDYQFYTIVALGGFICGVSACWIFCWGVNRILRKRLDIERTTNRLATKAPWIGGRL